MKKARLGLWMVAFALVLALTAASSADAKKVINLNMGSTSSTSAVYA